jgi:hypothetical protein
MQPHTACLAEARAPEAVRERRLERETGIEPATNSLEGCDSTTELLPPFDAALAQGRASRVHKPVALGDRYRFSKPLALSPRRRAKRGLPPDRQRHQTEQPLEPGLRGLVGRGGFEPP